MKKIFSALAVAGMTLLAACGNTGGTSSNDSTTLQVGTSADYYPFEFIDEATGEIVGFDIDLMNHIAAELGYTVNFVDMDFNTLITALRTGVVDVVISGMSATDERRELVDFTNIYKSSNNTILALNDANINSVEDLNGLVIGAQTATLQDGVLHALLEDGYDFEIQNLERIPLLVQNMLAGRIDAVIVDTIPAQLFLRENANLASFEIFPGTNGEGLAIALPLNSDRTPRFNEVLAEVKSDGTFQTILDRWFTPAE